MSISICLLCGGVGGARAALALSENFPHDKLTFVVNTGDDFSHLGLEIWPDWDTVIYTLSSLGDKERGWGRADEGTKAMEEWGRLKAPTWFHLGDRDLALHVYRQWSIGQGKTRAQIAEDVTRNLSITCKTIRATENSLDCCLELASGETMEFQDWFVRHQGKPEVKSVNVRAANTAHANPEALTAIANCDLLLIAPSNPYLSIGPMLSVPQVAKALHNRLKPTWAISPLIEGKAVKGPLDSLIDWLSPTKGQQAIADWYSPWAQKLLLPSVEIEGLKSPLQLLGCSTWLGTKDKRSLFVSNLLHFWDTK